MNQATFHLGDRNSKELNKIKKKKKKKKKPYRQTWRKKEMSSKEWIVSGKVLFLWRKCV